MNWGSMINSASRYAGSISGRAWRNPMARAAMAGAAIGGIRGGYSDNGSVLGGAMKGALLGAGAYRYAARPMMAVNRMGIGAGMGLGMHASAMGRAYATAVGRTFSRDFRGVKMMANQGFNKIRGLF